MMRETSDFSGCLAIATVGQKAEVGQGLPNIDGEPILTKLFLYLQTHWAGQTC